MARFDVYANPEPGERRHTPYLLDVQNDYISALASRVVIPLRRQAAFGPPAGDLNPVLSVEQDMVVLDTAALGAVPMALLKPPVANLRRDRETIQEALDALFGSH
jgi:toxin CcdB